MYDYHVHSSFSADCRISMEEMIQQAIQIGLKEVCFTDHIDYDYQDPSIHFEFDLNEYDYQHKNLLSKYKNQIKIRKGVEIGIQPHITEKCNSLVLRGQFDFVIASMHTADRKDIHTGEFFADKTSREAYEKYFNELLTCIKHFQYFNVIGHMDVLKRYLHYGEVQNIKSCYDIIEEIFKILVQTGKGIEINTSGFRYNIQETFPSQELLKLYKKLGGEIISIGSDAHDSTQLAYKFDYAYHLLNEIGFNYICIFKNMKPIFQKL